MDKKKLNDLIDKIKEKLENEIQQENNDRNELVEKLKETIANIQANTNTTQKYPRFKISLSKNEIDELSHNKSIIKNKEKGHILNPEIFQNENNKFNLTPLEKLLLGILWKNGDYKKESHIINGILYEEETKDDYKIKNGRYVFWNFGRYLKNKKRPIADQHTIRAYTKITGTEKKETQTYIDYLIWFDKIINAIKTESSPSYNVNDISYYLDRVLFELGKKCKKIGTP